MINFNLFNNNNGDWNWKDFFEGIEGLISKLCYKFAKLLKLLYEKVNDKFRRMGKLKIGIIFFIILFIFVSVEAISHYEKKLLVNPFFASEISINGTEGNGVATLETDFDKLKKEESNYKDSEVDRLKKVASNSEVKFDKKQGLSTGDKVVVEVVVPDKILKDNKVELSKNTLSLVVPNLSTEEEFFEEKYGNYQKISQTLIDDYIQKNTTGKTKYTTPIFLGVRDSTCDYVLFDYSVERNGDKRYMSSFIYGEDSEENKVSESTEFYSDASCNLESKTEGATLLSLSENKINQNVYDKLESISKEEQKKYIETKTTKNTHYSDFNLLYPLIVNDEYLVFVYSGEEYNTGIADTTYNVYNYMYITNIYTDGDELIDYYVENISVQIGEGLSQEEAYGQEFYTDDKVEKNIHFE